MALLDMNTITMIYRLGGRTQVENLLKGVLLNQSQIRAIQKKNQDDPQEAIDKRDAAIDAICEYAEELANLDND